MINRIIEQLEKHHDDAIIKRRSGVYISNICQAIKHLKLALLLDK